MLRMLLAIAMVLALLIGSYSISVGADEATSTSQASDDAAIRASVQNYVVLFNQGDAKGLAALWSPEAVYTNPLSGEQVVGRPAIEEQFAGIFANAKQATLEAVTESVQFVSPNVAIEKGTAKVVRPDQTSEASDYSAVYVKRDGKWLLDRVTETDQPIVAPSYEHLKDLEWMIGDWVDADDLNRIDTNCQWTKNQSFINRSFTVSVKDRIELSGIQMVGWDPTTKQIRSRVFDSDGGYGEGVWSKKGNRWTIHTTGTLADGRKTSSVNIITLVDNDTFTWQSINREVDGEILPNVDEVVVVRQKSDE